MTDREIVKRVISFTNPPRIGHNFNNKSDLSGIGGCSLQNPTRPETDWGKDEAILAQSRGFDGWVKRDVFGNIWGRLESITKGEVIRGVIEDDWSQADDYVFPIVDTRGKSCALQARQTLSEKYLIGWLPGFPFSVLRYMRGMENFLMDVILEPERVQEMSERVISFILEMVDYYGDVAADAVGIAEDWGTQNALLINPRTWRTLFRPGFERIIARIHERGMHFYMHSCGYIYEIIEDLIDVGVNVLQLDQPELMGLERLSREFGGRIAFDCPVDIQKVMPTGDRELIEQSARDMVRLLGGYSGGLIAKDYPQWDAIGVEPEWADWAREAFIRNGVYHETR